MNTQVLRTWSLTDIRPVALFLAAEFLILRLVTKGQYAALSTGYDGLLTAHVAVKGLALAVLLMIAAIFLRQPGASFVAAPAHRAGLFAVNLMAFIGLLVVQMSLLPVTTVRDDVVLTSGQIQGYVAAISLMALISVTSFLLLMPAAWARHLHRPVALLPIAALVLAVIFTETRLAFGFEGLRALVEGTTLSISLAIYSLLSDIPPFVGVENGHPTMAVPGFGVIIGPGCSGYQGVAAALVLLGAYGALERKTLRLGRAAVVVVVAVVGTFLLNATRIALLFHIGVTISPDMAVEGFHSHFGTLAVFAATAGAILVMETSPFRKAVAGAPVAPRRALPRSIPAPEGAPEAPLILPLAVLMIVSVMVGLTVEVINWFYGMAMLTGLVMLYLIRDHALPLLRDPPTLAGFGAGVLVFGIWIVMVPPDAVASDTFSTALFAASPAVAAIWIVVRALGASIVVPLVEELAFRGALQPMIARAVGRRAGRLVAQGAGILGSSVIFGLLHSDMMAGFVASLIYASLSAWQGGRVTDAILAHTVTNLLLVMTVLVFGHWSYW